MVSIMEIMQLCRLCLVKEQVNIPIFEEQDDVRQICLKITSCLPVKITKEDKLPKKICDGCLYKLELLYQFYNTTANAEKQLLTWIEQINMDANEKNLENLAAQSTPPTVKQEKLEPVESTNENPDMSAEAQNYMLDQETFQPDFTFKESQGSTADAVDAAENSDEPLAKRPRRGRPRQATKPIPPESLDSSDNDNDNDDAGDSMLEMTVTKTEEESESEGEENVDDPEPTKFEAVGEDTEQPGPSGLGKGGADGPFIPSKVKVEDIEESPYFVTTLDIKEEDSECYQEEIDQPNTAYTCEQCGKGFKAQLSYERHKKAHHAGHKCEFCDQLFTSKRSMVTHRAQHTKDANFKCDKCERSYFRLCDLKNHQIVHHSVPSFSCDKCGKGIKTKYCFEEHLTTHAHNRKEYACELCSTVLHHKKSYNRHMRSHQGTTQVMCDICGKSISRADHLANHKRTHSGERPYACGTCEKAFTTKGMLVTHMQTHTKAKPHRCGLCDKNFAHIASLKIHMRQHTGERPYPCLLCDSRFVSNSNLKKHYKRKH